MNTDQHPPFTHEMIADNYVLLGRGGTFKVPGVAFEARVMLDGGSSWLPWVAHDGSREDAIYAAPRSSEVARINGLGDTEESSDPVPTAYDHVYIRYDELARLREENLSLKLAIDTGPQVSSAYHYHEVQKLRDENERLKEENSRMRRELDIANDPSYAEQWLNATSERLACTEVKLAHMASERRLLQSEVERLGNQLTDGVQLNKKHCDEKRELREALKKIAVQRLTDEMDEEMQDSADYEYAYNEITKSARETIAKHPK